MHSFTYPVVKAYTMAVTDHRPQQREHLLKLAGLQGLEPAVLLAQVLQLPRHALHRALQPRMLVRVPPLRRRVLGLQASTQDS